MIGLLIKVNASDMTTLASTKIPKYIVSILFLELIAYILERNRIGWLCDAGGYDVPQCDEDLRREQEEYI